MSENLDLVRSICAPWEHGDYGSADWAHPEIEVVSPDGPTPGTWNGPAEMAKFFRQFLSAWDDVRTDVEEYRELDRDRVLVFTHSKRAREDQRVGTGADLGDHCRSFRLTRRHGDETRPLLGPRPRTRRPRP